MFLMFHTKPKHSQSMLHNKGRDNMQSSLQLKFKPASFKLKLKSRRTAQLYMN